MAAVVAACALLPPAILGIVGFGTAGVVAGSAAAAWMPIIGNVTAGSLFSILQSLGTMGIGVAATPTMLMFKAIVSSLATKYIFF